MRKASGEIKELTVFSTGRRPHLSCNQPPLSLDCRREPPATRAECSWGKGMKMGQDAEGDDPEVGPMIRYTVLGRIQRTTAKPEFSSDCKHRH